MVDEAALDTVYHTMLEDERTPKKMLAEWASDHDYFSDKGFELTGAHIHTHASPVCATRVSPHRSMRTRSP